MVLEFLNFVGVFVSCVVIFFFNCHVCVGLLTEIIFCNYSLMALSLVNGSHVIR